jgi:hypothetical protein
MLMVDTGNTELVACCIPLETQHATINQNSATSHATINATYNLKALAGTVLERNKPCNSSATDTPKHTQLLPKKNSEKVALVAPQLQWGLAESDKQKILAWLAHIGEKDQVMIDEVLEQVTDDAGALAYFLNRAEEAKGINQPITLVQCGNCLNFESFYDHGKASGMCRAGVMPSGVCHWSERQHTCDKHQFNQ